MKAFTILGLAAILFGCACIYLASGNQRWRASSLPPMPARAMGGLMLVLGWIGLACAMQTLAACFVFMTTLMLFFMMFPYVGAVFNILRGR